jgi:DNA-binding NarL/FixJ family response regulator
MDMNDSLYVAIEGDQCRIRVLVLHADPIAQAGLSTAIRQYPDLEVQDAVDACSADVVIADYGNGVALASRCSGDNGACPKVLVVAETDREWEVRTAMERGVRGYLLLTCAFDALAAGVRAVHRGGQHLGPQVAVRLAQAIRREPLTRREEEALRLVVAGLANKVIAFHMGIATATVKAHLMSAFGKLNVRSRAQAIAAVEQNGLLSPAREESRVA